MVHGVWDVKLPDGSLELRCEARIMVHLEDGRHLTGVHEFVLFQE